MDRIDGAFAGPRLSLRSAVVPQRAFSPAAVTRGLAVEDCDVVASKDGIYNLAQPELAERFVRRKVEQIVTIEPDAVVSANAGCVDPVRRYLDAGVPPLRFFQLVDAAIRGADPVSSRVSNHV